MISQIQLCLRHRGRVSNRRRFYFKDGLSVIVGPNGSGKSSLLQAIDRCPECRKTTTGTGKLIYFNSETMNPHRQEHCFKGISGSIIRVRAMFSSHGETLRDVLRYFKFSQGDCFLLDEPENGHDLSWTIKIYQGLTKLSAQGLQVIVASHHPVFWRSDNKIELAYGYLRKAQRLYQEQIKGTL